MEKISFIDILAYKFAKSYVGSEDKITWIGIVHIREYLLGLIADSTLVVNIKVYDFDELIRISKHIQELFRSSLIETR